jgi:hypothetical protein
MEVLLLWDVELEVEFEVEFEVEEMFSQAAVRRAA